MDYEASGDLDYEGQCVWNHFMVFGCFLHIFKHVTIYFSSENAALLYDMHDNWIFNLNFSFNVQHRIYMDK